MTGVQRLVDEVRARIEAVDQTNSDQLRRLAEEYAAECTAAESRLRRCEELARDGYRGEALYLAELDPPLLEVMSVLSFAERRQWAELVGMYGLPEAPPLSLARARELNQSYADYPPVEPLVKRLRHLSRARAPLTERAAVLRELCGTDANCPLWANQLEAIEADLRADLIRALEADLRAGDRARMPEYYAALRAPGWRKPPTPAVVAKAAAECLPRIIADMTVAVKRDDLAAARRARAEWDRVARDAMLIPGDRVTERGAELLTDIDRMERRADRDRDREDALEDFREAVHRGAAVEDLTAAYDRAREAGAKLPRPLVDQYNRLLSRHDTGRDVKQTIFGIVGIVIGAMVLITFLVLVLRR